MRRTGWAFIVIGAAVCLAACVSQRPSSADPRASRVASVEEACQAHVLGHHEAASAAIDEKIRGFQLLAEQVLTHRAEMIEVGQQLTERIEAGRPLSGEEIGRLGDGFRALLETRRALWQIAESHECWLDLAGRDGPPGVRRTGILLSLAAALLLYDNYLLAVSLYEEDPKLRRLLNERDPAYAQRRGELAQVTQSYHNPVHRARVRRAIAFYETDSARLSPDGSDDAETAYLHLLIQQSPSYRKVRDASPFSDSLRQLRLFDEATGDALVSVQRQGVSLFSMLFGNTMGLVETRRGKLFRRPDVAQEIQLLLRPGDILLEKTPFRLTDKLIPGYWGHAAIWVGGEAELRELGIWDHPVVARHREALVQGRQVAEALRPGVQLNTLERFLNIDDLGVLRRPDLGDGDIARIVLETLRQVGKGYDFTFDVERRERLFCSKLVYVAHGDVAWPTRQSLGRATFLPDDLALHALRSDSLQLVAFYHDGRPVREAAREHFARLLSR
jgi:hypothetical protein